MTMSGASPTSQSQRTALETYIAQLETGLVKKYRWRCIRYQWSANSLQIGALVCTATTTILAGLYSVEGKPGFFLIALPALTTLLLALRGVLKLPEVWRRQEAALVEFEGLVVRAKLRLAAADSEEKCGQVHRDVEGWARRLERRAMVSEAGTLQGAGDTSKNINESEQENEEV